MDWGSVGEFLLQLTAIVVSVLIVVYQVGRQHRSSLELQRENLKDEQRLKLFDDLSEKIVAAEKALVDLSLWGFFVPSELRNFIHQSRIPGFTPVPVRSRSTQFLEKQREVDKALNAVIRTIEYREVIDPAFVIFRYAITSGSEKCREAFNAFNQAILPLLPVDPPPDLAAKGITPRSLKAPTEEDVEALEPLGRSLHSEYLELGGYLSDLSREAQNRLIGSLFAQQLQPRRPLEEGHLVIGTSKDSLLHAEKQLELAKHIHPDSLPSRVLYPPETPSFRRRLLKWRRP